MQCDLPPVGDGDVDDGGDDDDEVDDNNDDVGVDDDDEVGRRWSQHNEDTGTLARRVAAGTARLPRPNQIGIPGIGEMETSP
ncbi:hypothetical protein V3C99_017459 [Haemonchus contortus]|uniref:Uncharacterized protein n=1 Tax=Haemonchus contortus TaxID=6289 RepID=A0A7I4Z492_HAECO|nr:unnamed protein product [Haemonchus contortus]